LKRELEISKSFIKAFGFRVFCQRVLNAAVIRPFRRYVRGSYSMNYEDVIIDKLLDHKRDGFYVDIGANDPLNSNNTMRFYRKGWSGINIEPNIRCYRRIVERRKRDVNLNIGIGKEAARSTFYSFLPDTRSTFSAEVADRLIDKGLKLMEKNEVEIWPLSEVLGKYRPDETIDFMSIDTEGYDDQVILSNDWEKYRPGIICIEAAKLDTTHRYLLELGYVKVDATSDNSIYQLRG
jgi:FkbM family methyltransferase